MKRGCAAAPIDPRIRERRSAVMRRRQRRRLRLTGSVMALGSLLLLTWAALRSPLLDVDRVRVSTSGLQGANTSPGEVARAADAVGRALIDLDQAAAERRIERLPWVQKASVRRSWPSSIEVTVVERQPVAVVSSFRGSSKMLVDATGRVLAVARVQDRLPQLIDVTAGRPGESLSERARPLLAVASRIPPAMLSRLAGIGTGSGSDGVELRLRPEGIVRLGRADEVGAKLTAVMSVLEQVDTARLSVLDVRVPSSPVLTRSQSDTKVSTKITG